MDNERGRVSGPEQSLDRQMSDLTAALTRQTERVEEIVASGGRDAVLAMHVASSLRCEYELILRTGVDGPRVVAHASVDPGGCIAEAHLEARDDERSATVDIEPGTALWRAIQWRFTDMWGSWDEVHDAADGEVLGVEAHDLRPGDQVVRLGLTASGCEDIGHDTTGTSLLAVRFEGTEGVEVWPADRALTVVRRDPPVPRRHADAGRGGQDHQRSRPGGGARK